MTTGWIGFVGAIVTLSKGSVDRHKRILSIRISADLLCTDCLPSFLKLEVAMFRTGKEH